ncbi:MAG TPA: type II secretion system F family protein, partial [Miltoncostaeaceae bacterium]|nr:type II secretion system F family protein [Miltoncostaeaceae bacterium]
MSAPSAALALLAAAALLAALALARTGPVAPVSRPRASAETTAPLAVRLRIPAPAGLRRLARERLPEAVMRAAASEPHIRPGDVAAAQAAAAVGGLGAGLLLALAAGPAAVLAAPALALAGWLLPVRAVTARSRRRAAAIRAQLPDLLDLLALCVEGGMAVDPALTEAARRLRGPLGQEVRLTLADVALGATRRSAYGDLAARVPLPEIAQVVGALLQADELGAPLSRSLRGQAAALRDDRRRRARERAARAAPKIQLVVALLMVPAAMLLV